MKSHYIFLIILSFQFPAIALADNLILKDLLMQYQVQGASMPNAERGSTLWIMEFPGKGEFKQRSCSSCHGNDITKAGKHIKTGKTIKAMSPTVNAERFSKKRKVEKWFKRNCKWTFGRECTVQEKADFLFYFSNPVIL